MSMSPPFRLDSAKTPSTGPHIDPLPPPKGASADHRCGDGFKFKPYAGGRIDRSLLKQDDGPGQARQPGANDECLDLGRGGRNAVGERSGAVAADGEHVAAESGFEEHERKSRRNQQEREERAAYPEDLVFQEPDDRVAAKLPGDGEAEPLRRDVGASSEYEHRAERHDHGRDVELGREHAIREADEAGRGNRDGRGGQDAQPQEIHRPYGNDRCSRID